MSSSILVRVPAEMRDALHAAAREEGTNLSALFRTLAEQYLKQREYQQLYDGFTALGEHSEEADVEYAIHAAAEVVLADE